MALSRSEADAAAEEGTFVGDNPTPAQTQTVKDYIYRAELKGLHNVPTNPTVRSVLHDLIESQALERGAGASAR